ncbi:MAG: Gfo/Idh/MocA family protein [Planctomycetota bacterium]
MFTLGIIGCGDFLRWQTGDIRSATQVRVAACFDPDNARAQAAAETFQAIAAPDAAGIFADASIDCVLLFVPPWIRADLLAQAAAAGKHILTTKPLGCDVDGCQAMQQAVADAGVRCGVVYGRTGDAVAETWKDCFLDGTYGQLALYKRDWLHHYPQWNDWATDPQKNGGPFMDAMVHNLNAARYLAGRPISHACYLSQRLVHDDIACNDTETMLVDFQGGGSAHNFITWAADLAVHSTQGNDREHIDQHFLITSQGWYGTTVRGEHGPACRLTRGGEEQLLPLVRLGSVYDDFAAHVQDGGAWPRRLAGIDEAAEDIRLLRTAEKRLGERFAWDGAAPGA